jgi:hypothetical protein
MLILLATLALVTGCARECWVPDSNYTCEPFAVAQ